jgi:thiol-disulfide isomerase/thioredoxin
MLRRILFFLWLFAASQAWAENVVLSDLASGESRSFTSLTGEGKWTLFMLWASDCGVCRREAPEIERFHTRQKNASARVVGISLDGPEYLQAAREFVSDYRLSFPNMVAEVEDVMTQFYDLTGTHMLGTPSFLLFAPDGQVRSYQVGPIDVALLEQLIQHEGELAVVRGEKR